VLQQTAIAVVAANPNILPLEFLLGIMRDPAVAPDLRIKVAQAAAPYCHPKPTTGVPTDPGAGAMVIDVRRTIEDAALVAEAERQSDLRSRQELAELLGEDNPLTEEERAELEALNAKGDLQAALPQHLRPVVDPEEAELRAILNDRHRAKPPRQRTYDDPGERRRRLVAGRQATVERHGPNDDEDE
jgi:hypothetical protein